MGGFAIGVKRPARPRREGQIVGEAEPQPLDAGPGDHHGIIGAQGQGWGHEREALPGSGTFEPCELR